MIIGNPPFCLFLYLTGVHFRGELQHSGDVSQQKIKCRPIIAREIGGTSLSDGLYINYGSELTIQLVLSDNSTNHNVGLSRSIHFKLCQMTYLFKKFIMLPRTLIYSLGYDLSNISAKLVVSLKHNIIFAKFLEIPLDNNVTSSHTYIR